jgi:hypothetical protein
VGAVLVGDRLIADETQAQLADDGVGLQRMIAALVLQQSRRDLTQVRMDHREQLVAGVRVPLAPPCQPAGDLRRRWGFIHGASA